VHVPDSISVDEVIEKLRSAIRLRPDHDDDPADAAPKM
jgi:hypothetical protein